MNPEAVPVKSLVGYGDEGPDGHHQDDQAEMDQVRHQNPYNTYLNAYLSSNGLPPSVDLCRLGTSM